MRLILCWLCLLFLVPAAALQVDMHAHSAILMNADTGRILFEKEAFTVSFPASVTKVATALFLLEEKKIDLNQMVTVSGEALRQKNGKERDRSPSYYLANDATKMGVVRGEALSMDSLLHGLMLVSGGDAANAMAEVVSSSIPQFTAELNQFVEKVGCRNTHFMNPHGYHHPEHVSTAYDLCLLTQRALKIPKFREIVGKSSYLVPKTNKQPEKELKQFNALVRKGKNHYPKAIGVKTGYHSAAMRCLSSAATDQGRTLIAVLLGCQTTEELYTDTKALFEAAFSEKPMQRQVILPKQIYQKTLEGAKTALRASIATPLSVVYFPSEEPKIKAYILWDTLSLPIRKGQKVGVVSAVDEEGHRLSSEDLLAKEDVESTFFFKIKQMWRGFFD